MGLINSNYISYNGTNITAEEYKNILKGRNLYSSIQEYPEVSTRQKMVNTVSTVYDYVQPFKTHDLRNTIYGRLVTIPNTPLTDIGLIMLGKQFLHNTRSSFTKSYVPDVSLKNIFTDKPIFNFPINFSITKPIDEGGFTRFLRNVTNFYPQSLSPFPSHSLKGTYRHSSVELIENTGTAQLEFLFYNLNNNIYKPNDENYDLTKTIFHQNIYFEIQLTHWLLLPDYIEAIEEANYNMIQSKNNMIGQSMEYAPNPFYVDLLGRSDIKERTDFDHTSNNDWVEERKNDNNTKLVWGRDGINKHVDTRIGDLRGISDQNKLTPVDYNKFGIKDGLLEYTRNLLIANRGNKIDITRKVFKKGVSHKIEGFQGSPLWKAPDTAPTLNAGEKLAGETGIRQHTVLDPYDNFAKSIRFDGNKLYGGNSNSVIHNSVLPKIHPIRDDEGKVNAKNMMFSVENLAVRVINKDDEFGILDDGNQGIMIPTGEIGPNMGRVMWFAPYDLQFSETTNNTFETTVMMGRGEPIYNYQYSERSATIRFKLIIDHPPKIKNMTSFKEISEFFAFGGYGDFDDLGKSIVDIEKRIDEIDKRIGELEKPTESSVEPNITPPEEILVVFPNDIPKIGNEYTVFDDLYKRYSYEVRDSIMSNDGTTWGLNKSIYCYDEDHLSDYSDYTMIDETKVDISQYDCIDLNVKLNSTLKEFFEDETNRELFDINITTSATKLYYQASSQEEYNQKLSERRAEATKYLLTARLEWLFDDDLNNLGITINTNAVGSTESVEEFSSSDTISEQGAKLERSARIKIERNNKNISVEVEEPNEEEKRELESIKSEREDLTTELKTRKRGLREYTYELRSKKEDAILDNYDSVIRKKFYPAFHSQTPEDFHRRLTFLQQCMRQGRSTPQKMDKEDDGVLRAKNSVFGRQPVSVLRIGDFFHTKVIIDGLTVDYEDAIWDMNPEGFGMQPMFADITLQIKLIGGQSLEGPISVLQNALAFNHYANSTYTDKGLYSVPSKVAKKEMDYREEINTEMEDKLREQYGLDEPKKEENIINYE